METDSTIRNCEVKFRRQCPLRWQNLQASGEPNVKRCGVCQKQVFFCTSDEETLMHAEQGHCIARQVPTSSSLPSIFVGEPEVLPIPTPEQEEAMRAHLHEAAVSDALSNIQHTSRRCAHCGFPFPHWWKRCRVCKCSQEGELAGRRR